MNTTALRTPTKAAQSSAVGALALEQARLAALYSYDILDALPDDGLRDLARMASQLCDAPFASITLLDHSRVWRVASVGMNTENARGSDMVSLEALRRAPAVRLVPDALHHPDWRAAAVLAAGEGFPVRFYACAPLVTADGHRLGGIEVMAPHRADLADDRLDSLRALAATVMEKLEIRRALHSLHAMHRHHGADANDFKGPLTSLLAFHDLLKRLDRPRGGPSGTDEDVTDLVGRSAQQLAIVASKVPSMLQQSQATADAPCWVNVPELVAETLGLLLKPAAAAVSTEFAVRNIRARRAALQQILLNLCSNAFRFVAKPGGAVCISLGENDASYLLYVSDNGPGILQPRLSQVFAMLYDGDDDAKAAAQSYRGLALVRRLAASMGGSVVVESEEGVGTTFCVSLPKGQ